MASRGIKTLDVMLSLLTKIRKGLETSQISILGALVFGSVVRRTETRSSDIDLLAVGENLNVKRHRRGSEIADIKKTLSGLPLDILLLTPQEVESNFRNHNPLFLDIAEEGIILIDDHRHLEDLIDGTRQYIKEKGIKKIDGGWLFPVTRGVPSYLSKVSNKDFSMAMIDDGDRDYQIGVSLIDNDYYDKAVYHFQQSVEKSVKSILIAMGTFQKTHLVGESLRKKMAEKIVPDEWREELLRVAETSESIEPEMSLSRYPGIIDDHLWLPSEEYVKEDAKKGKEKAAFVLTTAKRFVKAWFS